jgi:hypothetical protein
MNFDIILFFVIQLRCHAMVISASRIIILWPFNSHSALTDFAAL